MGDLRDNYGQDEATSNKPSSPSEINDYQEKTKPTAYFGEEATTAATSPFPSAGPVFSRTKGKQNEQKN